MKGKILPLLISAVVLLPALYSCTEDTPVEEKKLDSSLRELNFSKDGGSQQIFIVSEGVDSWDAYSTESWIDVAVDRDGCILTVTVAPSKEINGLSGKVFVYSEMEQMTEISVIQEGRGNIYGRSSLDIMGLRGPVESVDFYFAPKTLWLMQTQYLYNLEFDENGMLTHYENNYTAGSIVNFSFDLSYDDLNRLERIDVSTAGGDEYFPTEMTIDFIYGDHGKYISTQHLFTVADTWNCYLWQYQWMPRMIKDLAGIKLTSPMIAEYTDSDNVSVDIKVDGDSGEAVYNYNGESYAYESYTFTGAYTTGMVYDIDFVGIVIPSYVTYEVEPESGYITRFLQRNDEVFGVLSEEVYSKDVYNSLVEYNDYYQNYSRLVIEYNDSQDPVSVTHNEYGYSAKFDYTYDYYGNWVELDVQEMTQNPMQPLQTTRTITYYSNN